MKKIFKVLVSLVAVLAMTCAFAACGDNPANNPDDGEENSAAAGYTTFEAEGIDFTGLNAAGPSNSYEGVQMIWGKNNPQDFNNSQTVLNSISNGYCIGTMTNPDNNIDFVINSDAAATDCTLKIRMSIFNGSQFSKNTMSLNKDILAIYVNGVELDYDTIDIKGGATAKVCSTQFKDYTISAKFNLNAGENVIRLKAVSNQTAAYVESEGATAGAPAIDCIKVKSTSKLTWEDNWEDNKIIAGIQD